MLHRDTLEAELLCFPHDPAPMRGRRFGMLSLIAGVVAAGFPLAAPASATTLNDAMIAAYGNNTTLTGERAGLRQVDEEAAIARAQGRPQLSIGANVSQGLHGLRDVDGYNRSITGGPTLTVPLFQGGRVRNAIRAADVRVEGGRQDLRSVEGDIFTQTVTAYMDVLRDRAVLDFNMHNAEVLQTDIQSSQARFKGGDLTRTDVDQSEARYQQGESQLAAAQATLVASEETFRRLTGLAPDALEPAPALPVLPTTQQQAEETALANNPALAAAAAAVKAAGYDVGTARAARLPTLSATASDSFYSYRDRFAGIGNAQGNSSQVGVSFTLPLYQGGLVSAQVREARDKVSQAIEQQTGTERQVVADVRSAFASYLAAVRTIASSEAAANANTRALKGVRTENNAGLRQVLDVLNAQLELLNSQVALVTARHDAYIEGFRLLETMGLVDYKHLDLQGGALYDPVVNYRHAVRSFGDFSDGPRPAPVARRVYGPTAPIGSPPAG